MSYTPRPESLNWPEPDHGYPPPSTCRSFDEQETHSMVSLVSEESPSPAAEPAASLGRQPTVASVDPIVQQPASNVQGGLTNGNCPPGLEYLCLVDQLLVHQQVELLEAFTGFETNNKYMVVNTMGQNVYMAVEDNDCITRMCCGPVRPFDMNIFDNLRNEVIHLYRPLACTMCCCPCCLQTLEVSSPPGTVVGSVEQEWSLWKGRFLVKNAAGEVVLVIKGPCVTISCFGDVDFKIYSKDGEQVGAITKQWSGLIREMFTDADNFSVTFPLDLDVRIKAVLLGACFLIDFVYFEKPQQILS